MSRFLTHEGIPFHALLEPAQDAVRQGLSASVSPFALMVHDWAMFQFNTHLSKQDRLQRSHDQDLGYELGTALVVGAVLAAIVGAVCLRTSGMGFIMITLAFAQMAYFASISLKRYGGEDGLPVNVRSQIGGLDMGDDLMFYLLVLAVLGLVLLGLHRLVHSRFGMALQGSRINERRMTAMGLPVFRYRLLAYVLSAEICVVAGVLLANLTRFVSPSYMQWSMSGELIVMVVLGGLGTLLGPVVGAASLIVLEEALSSLHLEAWPSLNRWVGDHWLAVVGIFIVLVTLNLHRGLLGSLRSSGDPT